MTMPNSTAVLIMQKWAPWSQECVLAARRPGVVRILELFLQNLRVVHVVIANSVEGGCYFLLLTERARHSSAAPRPCAWARGSREGSLRILFRVHFFDPSVW